MSAQEIKSLLYKLASKNPFLSETELARIICKRVGREPKENEIKIFRNAAEDYRYR